MKEYVIQRINSFPDWSRLPVMEASEILWEPDAGIRMFQQIAYDDEGLLLRQVAREKNIRSEGRDPLYPVCEDSCMEFFFSPSRDGRYFNLECNPNGCIYFGFGTTRALRARMLIKHARDLLSLDTGYTDEGWEVRYAVPFAFLRQFYPDFAPKPGDWMTGNCYKCGDRTEKPHFLAWNPVLSEKPDFHRPECFGKLVFG